MDFCWAYVGIAFIISLGACAFNLKAVFSGIRRCIFDPQLCVPMGSRFAWIFAIPVSHAQQFDVANSGAFYLHYLRVIDCGPG